MEKFASSGKPTFTIESLSPSSKTASTPTPIRWRPAWIWGIAHPARQEVKVVSSVKGGRVGGIDGVERSSSWR